jgi:hypothetical protein
MLDPLGGSVMITFSILSLLTLTIGIWWLVSRKRRRDLRNQKGDIPLFTIPVSELVTIGRPAADGGGAVGSTQPSFELPGRAPSRSAIAERDARAPLGPPTIRTRDGAVSTLALPPRPGPVSDPLEMIDDDALGEAVDGASVRYWRVADGTLQFLPGRLAISAGHDAGHEIRFVRTAGPDGTSVTFGRADGAPYRHVQLREPTVSRAHARMSLEQSFTSQSATPSAGLAGNAARWRLENLSSTNPVVVNGKALGTEGGPTASVILSDGDRIEMGEVAFVFHSR